MIKVTFKEIKEVLKDIDRYFELNKDNSWFEDPIVKDICLNIGNMEHIVDNYFKHKTFGGVTSEILPTGAKTLILLLKYNNFKVPVATSRMGDNCWEYLKYLPEDKDIYLYGNSTPPMNLDEYNLNFYIEELDITVSTFKDYWGAYKKVQEDNK